MHLHNLNHKYKSPTGFYISIFIMTAFMHLTCASLIDPDFFTKPPEKTSPPPTIFTSANAIVISPAAGETIEVLYVDQGAGIKYYRAIGGDYERGGRADVHGGDYNIVPPVNKVHFSDMKKRFYWSTNHTIESILIN